MLKMIRDAFERTSARRKKLKGKQRLIDSLEGRKSAELASLRALGNLELAREEWERREAEGIGVLKTVCDDIEFYGQEELQDGLERAGIEIPDRMRTGKRKFLTEGGKRWAHVELRRYRQQQIEFWAKLVLPILTLIMSIIALVFSIRKH